MSHGLSTVKQSLLDFSQLKGRDDATSEHSGIWFLLRSSENGGDQHRTRIAGDRFSVGRRLDCDLCVADPTVSGNHAAFEFQGDRLFLSDSGSTNGTLVNGACVNGSTEVFSGDVIHFGQMVYSLDQKRSPQKPSGNPATKTQFATAPENAILFRGFDQLLNRPDIEPYFQPVVAFANGATVGYEVLVRSKLKGLEFPDRIFRIANLRHAEVKLSEVCRSEGLLSGIQLDPLGCYFLNTHAVEVGTPRLFESLRELRDNYPETSIVIEIHEAAITSVAYLTELQAVLRDLNIDLAYDDFGAGQARLIELFEVPPKYLKFDLSFVRGLENASKPHRASVRSLLNMVHDLDVIALAEGVETQAQSEICEELGFDLVQGYLFGRPQPREFWQEKMSSMATMEVEAIAGANRKV